jgi:hypothetical protein
MANVIDGDSTEKSKNFRVPVVIWASTSFIISLVSLIRIARDNANVHVGFFFGIWSR